MPRALAALTSFSYRILSSVAVLSIVLSAGIATADDAQTSDDQLRADCRAEGEAGGLDGTELEAFIRECVSDLRTVEIGNIDSR
ncbi:MAG: hypothetical protein QNJ91_01060 [Gammaproteobacteria bacterium]|nr:hypothetical protein [Gammaproteobacteria bacterium]